MNITVNKRIKSIRITKLFGKKNVHLNFDENVKIYVGENGIGKTTILNIIYYTLMMRFKELREFDFETIVIELNNAEPIIINREWLIHDEDEIPYNVERFINRVSKYLTEEEINSLIDHKVNNYKEFEEKYFDDIVKRGAPIDALARDIKILLRYFANTRFSKEISKATNIIKNNISEKILYFPTYRRIEEDLKKLRNLTVSEENDYFNQNLLTKRRFARVAGELIQFGMADVEFLINKFTDEIRKSSVVGYSQITGKMITHLVHDQKANDEMRESVRTTESLDIVLERVGDYLNENDKNKIRDLIASNEIFKSENINYDPLIYFLYNLIQLYEKQSENDNAIKNFKNACNKFLIDKEIHYDESSVRITILNKYNEKVELQNLSSGEKQIVSLFSKIYLDRTNNFLILFDEPELSLSIEWQEKLLPAIISSEKCNFMMVVTHSPFIYANTLHDYAESIENCIEEVSIHE